MQIMKEGEQYIIQYNSGDLTNSIEKIEVSKSDATRAQESEQSAYKVIIKYQNIHNSNNENQK